MSSLAGKSNCDPKAITLLVSIIVVLWPRCEIAGDNPHSDVARIKPTIKRRCLSILTVRLRGGSSRVGDCERVNNPWTAGTVSNSTGNRYSNTELVTDGSARRTPAKRKKRQQAADAESTALASTIQNIVKNNRPAYNFSRPRDGSCVVTLSLLSKSKFAASFKSFPKAVTDLCRRFKALYDPQQKRWTLPMTQYDQFLSALLELQKGADAKMPIKIDAIPDPIRAALRLTAPVNQTVIKGLFATIPDGLRESLMPFQQEGVCFGLAKNGRILIGDEMGLGKTIQAIALSSVFLSDWPTLVVCPSSMRMMWAAEFLKWLPGLLKKEDINVIFSGKDCLNRSSVTIISYDLFHKFKTQIEDLNCGVVIADEGHYLKNGQAKRTQFIVPVIKSSRRAIILTGTPALSRPAELFTLVHSIDSALFPDFLKFAHRYCDAHQGPFGLDTGGSSNLAELHLVLQEHTMVRRLKRDVLSQLPPKRRQRVFVQADARRVAQIATELKQLAQLEAVADGAADEAERARAETAKRALIMKLYVDTGQAKVEAVGQYVADLVDCGAKFLVFAHHLEVLDAIEAVVRAKRVPLIRIDGSTDPKARQDRVLQFQSNDAVRVAVLSLTAAGAGLTLTAAHTVVFAELHWVPGLLLQAEDRVHRIGQNDSVNIHYLVAQGTCDDLVWHSVAHKLAVVGRALDGQLQRLNAVCVDAPAPSSLAAPDAPLAALAAVEPSPADPPIAADLPADARMPVQDA